MSDTPNRKKYPAWIESDRLVSIRHGERPRPFPPTLRRIEDRVAIYDFLTQNKLNKDRIDDIINYFRQRYEPHKYKGLSREDRAELYVKSRGLCYWCSKAVPRHLFTVEHIKPLSEGGTWDWANLTIAHEECNSGRETEIFDRYGYFKDTSPHTDPDPTSP